MADQNRAIRDDIAFLRALAEEGRAGPPSGGAFLVSAGAVFGLASLATYGLIVTGLARNGVIFPILWFGAAGGFVLSMYTLRGAREPRSATSRAAGIAWSGAGWAIFTIVVGLMVLSWRVNNWSVMATLPTIIMAIYGSAWFVAAALTRRRWVAAVSTGSFLMAIVTAWCATGPALYLVYAGCLIGLLAVPGLVLMRQARRAA
jgi:hypothetical protein